MKKLFKIAFIFIIGINICCSCKESNKENPLDKYSTLITSLDMDSIVGPTNMYVRWRTELLFQIKYNDSVWFHVFAKENEGKLFFKVVGQDWQPIEKPYVFYMNNDSYYLEKDRIIFCYNLMKKHPIKNISYNAKYKMAIIDFDKISFFNIRDSLYLEEDRLDLKKLEDDWWYFE